MRAAIGCVAISGFWHEIASSKFSIFPRNDVIYFTISFY
ncbi:hypothetical protein RFEPED_0004 [Rickettsia felis str. Pedreira]|uniref:Uncharacterized protein n=1 Tax=Rickettsia felis str. Pedreira TaxID=1359196 RepID=A0A0F3MST2_RICFI|nr:hypothetical protein RFEPED_0004 [Rickettsia felis str. Pedreira]